MRKLVCVVLGLLVFALSICGCAPASSTVWPTTIPTPVVGRRVLPSAWPREVVAELPVYDETSTDGWQVDMRSKVLSALDLLNRERDLFYADFDSHTIWPAADKMPAGFDAQRIVELGKNPGLGVRALHAQGITGKGVGIAIIDQALMTEHPEYAGQVRLYEEINVDTQTASMHGGAVASIAVGKTVGVAPGADLYYIALWPVSSPAASSFADVDFAYYAQAIRRVLEINRRLAKADKIRVISLEIGWSPNSKGYAEVQAAAEEAKKAGMLVICSSVEEVHGFRFNGLGRQPLADPDKFESYEPGSWWAAQFYTGSMGSDRLLVPMDSRATAGFTSTDDYTFYRQGGWSWSIPYIAGMYALAAQVDPGITPDRFWQTAMETGRTIQVTHDGTQYALGPIVDPPALMAALGKKQ